MGLNESVVHVLRECPVCDSIRNTFMVASFPVSTPSCFSQHAEKKLGVETGNEATFMVYRIRKSVG